MPSSQNEIEVSNSIIPYTLATALGLVTGKESHRTFGFNPTVGATDELVSTEGVAAPYLPTTAVSIELNSANPADTAAGAGARAVEITGLDANCDVQVVTVATNGGTVAVSGTWRRVYFAQVTAEGTVGSGNTGILTVRQAGGGTTFVTIQAGNSRSFSSHYSVPRGYSLAIMDIHIQIESSTAATIKMISQNGIDTAAAPFQPRINRRKYNSTDGQLDWTYDNSPIIIAEKTDIWFSASADGYPSVSCEYIGILCQN